MRRCRSSASSSSRFVPAARRAAVDPARAPPGRRCSPADPLVAVVLGGRQGGVGLGQPGLDLPGFAVGFLGLPLRVVPGGVGLRSAPPRAMAASRLSRSSVSASWAGPAAVRAIWSRSDPASPVRAAISASQPADRGVQGVGPAAEVGLLGLHRGDAGVEVGDLFAQVAQFALAGQDAGLGVRRADGQRAVGFEQFAGPGDEPATRGAPARPRAAARSSTMQDVSEELVGQAGEFGVVADERDERAAREPDRSVPSTGLSARAE